MCTLNADWRTASVAHVDSTYVFSQPLICRDASRLTLPNASVPFLLVSFQVSKPFNLVYLVYKCNSSNHQGSGLVTTLVSSSFFYPAIQQPCVVFVPKYLSSHIQYPVRPDMHPATNLVLDTLPSLSAHPSSLLPPSRVKPRRSVRLLPPCSLFTLYL